MSVFRTQKNTYGFTLIELLVVVSIIGLLSSVVLASLSSAKEKGRAAAAQEQVRQIQTAIGLCLLESGGDWPLEDEDEEICLVGGPQGNCELAGEVKVVDDLTCGSLAFNTIRERVFAQSIQENRDNLLAAVSFAELANLDNVDGSSLFPRVAGIGGYYSGLVYDYDNDFNSGMFYYTTADGSCAGATNVSGVCFGSADGSIANEAPESQI